MQLSLSVHITNIFTSFVQYARYPMLLEAVRNELSIQRITYSQMQTLSTDIIKFQQ